MTISRKAIKHRQSCAASLQAAQDVHSTSRILTGCVKPSSPPGESLAVLEPAKQVILSSDENGAHRRAAACRRREHVYDPLAGAAYQWGVFITNFYHASKTAHRENLYQPTTSGEGLFKPSITATPCDAYCDNSPWEMNRGRFCMICGQIKLRPPSALPKLKGYDACAGCASNCSSKRVVVSKFISTKFFFCRVTAVSYSKLPEEEHTRAR